jgi:hypothetical protein
MDCLDATDKPAELELGAAPELDHGVIAERAVRRRRCRRAARPPGSCCPFQWGVG